jgi:hydrogenase maturation protein HypF
MEDTVEGLKRLLEISPEAVAHDLHPDYLSTHYAQSLALPCFAVQHHHAHMASCMVENGLEGEVIGVILDGSGFGLDGNIWGGEFLLGGYGGFKRCGHFGYLRMLGGDAAVREPYRMAISAMYTLFGKELFDHSLLALEEVSAHDRALFLKMLEGGINSPFTSSCGRIFDAVSALLGVRSRINYEGQAAIELESLAERGAPSTPYPYLVQGTGCRTLDFRPMFAAICADLARGRGGADIARAFHQSVAAAVFELCCMIREESGQTRVVLSGGVFQNRLLTEEVVQLLTGGGFVVYCHRLVPPNDQGVALGQAMVAGEKLKAMASS